MFVPTWNKYLPVIRILLKRSVNSEQVLDMNQSDFQRAAGGKKVKFTFSVSLVHGRLKRAENPTPLANDLISVLRQDDVVEQFFRRNEVELIMNSNFQLLIRNMTPPSKAEEENDAGVSNEEVNPGDTSAVAE